jgi:hypothetical protein
MSRVFTMQKICPACRCRFTITSAASVYCQYKGCQNKRRRDDYAARRDKTGPYAPRVAAGSDAHLARALESGE